MGGTVSFMSARTHAAPTFGSPAHWAAGLPETGRAARHSPERITAATEEAFHLLFLAKCAVPDAQMTTVGDVVHLVDVMSGSAATLTPREGRWEVSEGGPVKLWERIEAVRTMRPAGASDVHAARLRRRAAPAPPAAAWPAATPALTTPRARKSPGTRSVAVASRLEDISCG